MHRLFLMALFIIFTISFTGCSPYRSDGPHTPGIQPTPQDSQLLDNIPLPETAEERFDPENLMSLDTFEMNKRDVANYSGILTKPNENPKANYYGHQASVMFDIGDSWEYSQVTGFSYLLAHLEREELVDTLYLIVDDAISIYGEPHAMFCNNTPTDTIDMNSLYLSTEDGGPTGAIWEWKFEQYTLEIYIMTFLNVIFVSYEQC